MKLISNIRKIPLWIYLLILGLVTFYTYSITITSDMIWYMNVALNILIGKGYTNVDGSLVLVRGPIFPLMIAASFWFLGVSSWSAFWVIRLFALLNPVLIYFLGKQFYGKAVGFTSALLILSSYSMNYWSYRHLDAIWPSFTILSILALYLALENNRRSYFVISGILMGLAYSIKQAPILLFPLPFLLSLIIKRYRRTTNLIGSGLFLSSFALVILPWTYYVYSHSHNIPFALLGKGGQIAADTTLLHDTLLSFKEFLYGLYAYYGEGTNSLASNFTLAPLFVCAWLFTIYRAMRRSRPDIMLAILCLLLSPYISFAGRYDSRVGQLILFLLLSYIVIAHFVAGVAGHIIYRMTQFTPQLTLFSQKYVLSFFISFLVVFQLFVNKDSDKGNAAFLKTSFFPNISWRGTESRKVTGMFNQSLYDVSTWIRENAQNQDSVLCSWFTDLRSVYFLTEGVYKLRNMPLLSFFITDPHFANVRSNIPDFGDHVVSTKKDSTTSLGVNDILLISSQTGSDSNRNRYLWVLYESDLIANIQRNNIRYVIVGKIFNFLSNYFESSPFFKELISFNDGDYRIYEVAKKVSLTDHSLYITTRTLLWLNKLKKENNAFFIKIKDELFKDKLGVPNSVAETLANMNLPDNFVETTLVPKKT